MPKVLGSNPMEGMGCFAWARTVARLGLCPARWPAWARAAARPGLRPAHWPAWGCGWPAGLPGPALRLAWPALRPAGLPGVAPGPRCGPRVDMAVARSARPSPSPERVASLVQAQGPLLREGDSFPSNLLPVCPLAIREVFPCLRIGGIPYPTAGPLPIQRSCRATPFPRVIPRLGESLPHCLTESGVPKRSDRASLPPPGYLTVSEASLRAGLRFPPSAELVEILRRCGVCLSQLSYRAMSVTVGLIALFRDRGAVLTPEHLSRKGRLTSDVHGRVTFRCKWLDMGTQDPAKNWSSSYLFVRNDWGLLEKWGKMRELPAPLYVGEEDMMRLLKVPNIEHLLYEVCYLNKYIEEEFLFKNQQIDHLQVDLERASGERVAVLEAENKRSQTLIVEKEAALTSFESARVIDEFKKSIAFKIIIQDHVQEARDHIYEVEVKALEQQCLDDGFIQGFLKGRKTGVEVEGLTPSQASDDFPPGSDGDEIESELQKAFALEADDEVVDID
ncbi:hypothetical protein IEQ34_007745 [Dendrobium chrysotoxum]|uniref:Uncharacterized protein n=1 Tax=Dendrobium chrysotoxum TaxID=161865 RepID=A0AAV7H6G5_DENCH|nr:hypothetical protein IEQ34_007745 [Dendrobium chrysotoxum]